MLQANNYMEENLQLMKQLIPRMEKLIYIGDGTYICQQNDYDLSEIIQNKYPGIKYEFISAQNTSTDSLFLSWTNKIRRPPVLFSHPGSAKRTITATLYLRVIPTGLLPQLQFLYFHSER